MSFSAIFDQSFMLEVIDIIKKSMYNTEYKVYAIAALSISSQFSYARLGQVVWGFKELGIFTVVEVCRVALLKKHCF